MNEKITVTIETHEPIGIEAFCNSLNALEEEFSAVTLNSTKLMIKEIRKGSFEIDLITVATLSILPFMNNANTVIQFFEYFKKSVSILSGKIPKPEEKTYTMKELKNMKKLFGPVSSSVSEKSQLRVAIPNREELVVNKDEARQIIASVTRDEVVKLIPSPYFIKEISHSKVLFYWYQTRFDDKKINEGNQGVVQSIDPEPKKVIFSDDQSETKHQMTTTSEKYKKDWQEIGYIVDLELIVKGEKILAYKILKNYPDDAIIE